MAPLPYAVVDAFTSVPFKGNPAAVLILNKPLPDPILQSIATEFNLSQTAFVTPLDASKGQFDLRWFSPTVEFEICGHATLASAHILFSDSTLLPRHVKQVQFQTTIAGVLTATSVSEGRVELELPAGDMIFVCGERKALVEGAVQKAFSRCATPPSVINMAAGVGKAYQGFLIIEINREFDLQGAIVNMAEFVPLAPESPVIMITQRDGEASFKSRVFAPTLGVPEDPVCGSAHAFLGPYWAAQREGTEELLGIQVSQRYGEVGISLDRARKVAKLRGEVVTVCKGELFLPD